MFCSLLYNSRSAWCLHTIGAPYVFFKNIYLNLLSISSLLQCRHICPPISASLTSSFARLPPSPHGLLPVIRPFRPICRASFTITSRTVRLRPRKQLDFLLSDASSVIILPLLLFLQKNNYQNSRAQHPGWHTHKKK